MSSESDRCSGDGDGRSDGEAPVGLLYDERMCRHDTPRGEPHPESPDRIRAIWSKLEEHGIPQRCLVLNATEAADDDLVLVHTKKHVDLIKNISSKAFDSRREKIASKLDSIYLNKGSSESAYLAAGSVVEISKLVARGDLRSGIAVVRPPGHHAEADEAMGFCLFNNVAIAAKYLLDEKVGFGLKRVLIVDWDVHHGNGTQNMFYNDPRVLYFSVHRFDFGSFYPGGEGGAYFMIGDGPGVGYNINVPWEHAYCGDADYNAVWDHILIPVAKAYDPDIILVSAGFDAAVGDPLGGCCITPYGYSVMLKKLMEVQGKVVIALEGGYNLTSISNSVLACAKTLLDMESLVGSFESHPFESTWRVIQEVREELKTFWPVLASDIPSNLLMRKKKFSLNELKLDSSSDIEDEYCEVSEDMLEDMSNVGGSFSKLSVDGNDHGKVIASISEPEQDKLLTENVGTAGSLKPQCSTGDEILWNSFSNIDIWYGCYGSKLWNPRFLCSLKGGKVEGMIEPSSGLWHNTLPKSIIWKTVPHRLFFGRSSSRIWGSGGVAFLHPEISISERSHICLYKITLQQFQELLHQENSTSAQIGSPLLCLSDMNLIAERKHILAETLKDGWYSNVLYLGKEDDLPILTMTCTLSDIDRFKSSALPICKPSEDYAGSMIRGLVEGEQLTRDEAAEYVEGAASREL